MAEINSLGNQPLSQNSTLYTLAAQQSAAQQNLKSKKTEKASKTPFASILKKNQETSQLISEGLPPELAGMETEEAVNYLKDAMDLAGDELKSFQSLENLEKFREKVSQFMKYIVKNNFKINKEVLSERMKMRLNKKRKPIDPKVQVEIINREIHNLASQMLIYHGKNLNLLAKLEEINGLIIDLLAS